MSPSQMQVSRPRIRQSDWISSRRDRTLRPYEMEPWRAPAVSGAAHMEWEDNALFSIIDDSLDPDLLDKTNWLSEHESASISRHSWPLLVFHSHVEHEISPVLRHSFEQLVRQWKQETAFVSSSSARLLNSSYLRIIGLGPPAIPLILEEMRNGGLHWGAALSAITGENPAEGVDTLRAATKAWLEWAELGGPQLA